MCRACIQHAIRFAVVVGPFPRPVVVSDVDCREKATAQDRWRRRGEHPSKTVMAPSEFGDGPRQLGHVIDVRGTGSGELAFIGKIRPLLELNSTHELWNEQDLYPNIRGRAPVGC
jgi:hypothetical protein